MKIEAEGGELILKNRVGDHVIIPKNRRKDVQEMLKSNDNASIDELVNTLPVMDDYADDGTVVPKDGEEPVEGSSYVTKDYIKPIEDTLKPIEEKSEPFKIDIPKKEAIDAVVDIPEFKVYGDSNSYKFVDDVNDKNYIAYKDSLDAHNMSWEHLKKGTQYDTYLSEENAKALGYSSAEEYQKKLGERDYSFIKSGKGDIPYVDRRSGKKDIAIWKEPFDREDGPLLNNLDYLEKELWNYKGLEPDEIFKGVEANYMPIYKKPEVPVFVKGTNEYDNAQRQVELKEAGLYDGEIDGIWGKKSEAAYKSYELANNPEKYQASLDLYNETKEFTNYYKNLKTTDANGNNSRTNQSIISNDELKKYFKSGTRVMLSETNEDVEAYEDLIKRGIEPSEVIVYGIDGSDGLILDNFIYEKPKNSIKINTTIGKEKSNFEERINDPNQKSIDNKDGTSSTHKMMSFEADGKYYAAPTIVEIDGELKELSQEEAMTYALENNEHKEFKTEAEARRYAEGEYKKNTPMEKGLDKGKKIKTEVITEEDYYISGYKYDENDKVVPIYSDRNTRKVKK